MVSILALVLHITNNIKITTVFVLPNLSIGQIYTTAHSKLCGYSLIDPSEYQKTVAPGRLLKDESIIVHRQIIA